MIRRIHSGGPFEAKVGYCRAVVAGQTVYVAGTVGAGANTAEQCAAALATIKGALEQAGTDMAHVVRATYYLVDRSEFESCFDILRAAFGEHPPAAAMIECRLIDDAYRIEIEVTAVLPT